MDNDADSSEGSEVDKDVKRLGELFKGRFDAAEIECLLLKHECDLGETTSFILTAETREIREYLERNVETLNLVTERRELRRNHPDILTDGASGRFATECRLFACQPCDRFWWRKLPGRKKVSRCYSCKMRYEPVAKNREWGWGEFTCPNCGRVFEGWGQMSIVWSPCFGCGQPVYPTRIVPPKERNRQQRSRSHHTCGAPDCSGSANYRGNRGSGRFPDGQLGQNRGNRGRLPDGQVGGQCTCVHPLSRKSNGLPMVVTPSNVHASSGSTVSTFLTQCDMDADWVEYFNTLNPIPEGSDEEDSGNNE